MVHRGDGRGTTEIFIDYLSKVSPEWQHKVGQGATVIWLTGITAKRSDGVAELIKRTPGTISYVELTYAVQMAVPNRTARVRLADYIDEAELHHELDHVRTLRVNASELHYLRGTNEYGERIYSEAYLQFLKELRLPPYELVRVDDTYRLEFSGAWAEAIYWETLALPIVNKLYCRALLACLSAFERDVVMATGTLAGGQNYCAAHATGHSL